MISPEVSVIMPVYNNVQHIEKAIDSVLQQNVDTELIIINDCSTDSINLVLHKFMHDRRVIVINNERNVGVAQSRNFGVKIAKGEYIAYLDSDDWWLSGKLEKQIEIMKSKNCKLCFTGREMVKEDGTSTKKYISARVNVDYKVLKNHNYIPCSSVLLPTRVAREHPMCHDELHEDYINWLEILKSGGIAYGIDEPLIKYRISDNGKSRNKIKSIFMTYGVYRYIGMNKIQSFSSLVSHILKSIIKYKILPRKIINIE